LCATGSWTRTTDADTYAELVAAFTFVEKGTTNADSGFICTIDAGGTLGSTSITWAQFSGAGQITAGDGLTKTGNTLNVGTASSGRIVVNSDKIDLASSGITPGTYQSVTFDTYGRATAGTNPTTIAGYNISNAYTKTEIDSIFGSTTAAATSASNAATSASNASTSASNASTSASNASTSEINAAASYDAFDDRYLGSKSSAPTVDNDGNALLTGALYWNTAVNTLYVWTGSTWTQAAFTASGFASTGSSNTFTANQIVSVTDNTNAALRITQLGTGNALLVEDSTNPDATPFVINADGRVITGSNTAYISLGATPNFQLNGTGVGDSAFAINSWRNSAASGALVALNHSKSGVVGTFAPLISGDTIGAVIFSGDDGTAFIQAASISASVDGTPSTNDMPARLTFSTTADGASSPTERVRITSAGKTGFATSAPASTVHVAGDTILSNVNVIGASYDSVSFSVAGEEITAHSVFFSPDGLKMYVSGTTGDDVNEYNLSTAWVVSSAVYSTVFSVSSQDTNPQGLYFRADGLKMYIVGATNDSVFQYTLSTPWSVATASYDSISFSVATQETAPTGIFFKPNGLSMYIVGNVGDAVYQYTLSTAWDVSTATFLQSFSISSQEGTAADLAFTGDGSRMFVLGTTGDDVNVYNLTTPWDISTSAFVNVFSVSGQDTTPTGIYIKPDGTKMYIVGQTNDAVFQYTVPSIDIQLTGQTSIAALDVQQDLTVYGNIRGKLSSCTVDGTNEVGYKNIPQNSQSAAYTLVLADAGKHIFHPSTDANARTYTIPANSSVAYPIGTAITFINMTSQVVTIAITTDTMYLSAAGTTGSRSLAQYGSATAIKMTSTTWLISGSGLT
jgi:hypothetical protein